MSKSLRGRWGSSRRREGGLKTTMEKANYNGENYDGKEAAVTFALGGPNAWQAGAPSEETMVLRAHGIA